jgi:DNA-binding transcriptional MerR regulator
MKIYSWEEVVAETGVSEKRVKYAVRRGYLSLPKGSRYFVLTDETLLAIIRHFKDKPRYTHIKTYKENKK